MDESITGRPPSYEYDVALSYAGPDQAYAEHLARLLKDAQLAVFFDLFEQATILGKRLYTFLQDVYENKARYCVVLISTEYAQRIWPRHEIQAAFSRAVRDRGDYILPIRLDDTKIEGLPSDLVCINAKEKSVDQVAQLLIREIAPEPRREAVMAPVFADARSALQTYLRKL